MTHMQFSIPDTQEVYADISASTYTVYNIYINGAFHCALRYKLLNALDDQLRRRCAELGVHLPQFPPKRLLPLTKAQLETRRAALEHYLQRIVQHKEIARLDYFQQYLLRAQFDTALADGAIDTSDLSCKLDVLLPNGRQTLTIASGCRVNQNTKTLLQAVGRALQINDEQLLAHFSLYLVRRDNVGVGVGEGESTLCLLRWLMDFESPYISALYAQPCKLLLRKNYWNPEYDLLLCAHAQTLNLLHMQTFGDIAEGWIVTTPETRQQLRNLHDSGLKKQYVEFARHLPRYGCVQFALATIDYPAPQTPAIISIGNKSLSVRLPSTSSTTANGNGGNKLAETKFRVTRMRCWRVSAMHNTRGGTRRDCPTELQISFEYLLAQQTLRWITITSAQAMLMSVCLQSVVDDLLASDSRAKQAAERAYARAATAALNGGGGSSTPTSAEQSYASMPSSASTSSNESNSKPRLTSSNVKFLAEASKQLSKPNTTSTTYSAVFYRNDVQNELFDKIGNDDL